MKRNLVLLLLTFLALNANAQNLELGFVLGATTYEGELSPVEAIEYLQTYRPAFGFFTRYHISRRIAVRADLRYATIFGDDAINSRPRNLNFRTRLGELTLLGEWAPFSLRLGPGVYAAPYGHAGGGLLYFNPQGLRNNTYIDLAPLGTEGQGLPGYPEPYNQFTYVLTAGGGAKIEFNEQWTLGGEVALRYSGSDYLDDVGPTPVTYRDVLDGNGSTAAYFSRPSFNPDSDNPDEVYVRGGEATDFIFTAVITISFRLGNGLRLGRSPQLGCPQNNF